MNKKTNSGSFKKGVKPWNKGKKLSKIHCENLRISHLGHKQSLLTIEKRVKQFRGKKHWNWAEKPAYETLHQRISKQFGKAYKCEMPRCHYPRVGDKGMILKKPKRFEWSNKTGIYNREKKNWWQLCPSCHRKYDYKFNIKKPQNV
jgi:hypothetical protein